MSSDLGRLSDASCGSPASPIDRAVLAQLRDLDPDDFRQLIRMFLDEAAGRVARLQILHGESDAADMARLAHALRGTSAAFGATRLAELCAVVEAAPQTPATAGLETGVEAVAMEFDRVLAALTEELD